MCRNQLYYIHSHIACNNYDKTDHTAVKKIHRAGLPASPVFRQATLSSVLEPGRRCNNFFLFQPVKRKIFPEPVLHVCPVPALFSLPVFSLPGRPLAASGKRRRHLRLEKTNKSCANQAGEM
jgi:hypothetical protein